MKNVKGSLTLIFTCLFYASFFAQPILSFNATQSGFSSPVDIANAGDGSDRIFFVERAGVIKIIQGSTTLATPFLDISSQVGCCGERGLLGLAFHPAYASNGYFFVNYTDNNGDTQISRFTVDPSDPNKALVASQLSILKIDQPFANHNAGDLNFGPFDGYLYIAMGDGGSGGDPGDRSQDPSCLLGKVLRIDINGVSGTAGSESQAGLCGFENDKNYTIPPTNPFVGTAGVLDEIWSIGWRNPWRFCFDPMNGDMWVADVGQNAWEEVDRELTGNGGGNYGWRCYEGNHAFNTAGCNPASSYIDAVFEYGHNSSGGFSITGGLVYRGSLYPNMQGHYIVTDYVLGNTWTLSVDASGNVVSEVQATPGISSITTFGVRENGELLAASIGGQIYSIDDLSPLPISLIEFNGQYKDGINQLNWSTATEINADKFELEKSVDGERFEKIGELAAANANGGHQYSFADDSRHAAKNYYRLKMIDRDGSYSYSNIIILNSTLPFTVDLFPNPTDGILALTLSGELTSAVQVEVFNSNGALVFEQNLERGLTDLTLDFTNYASNVYLVRISSAKYVVMEKVVVK